MEEVQSGCRRGWTGRCHLPTTRDGKPIRCEKFSGVLYGFLWAIFLKSGQPSSLTVHRLSRLFGKTSFSLLLFSFPPFSTLVGRPIGGFMGEEGRRERERGGELLGVWVGGREGGRRSAGWGSRGKESTVQRGAVGRGGPNCRPVFLLAAKFHIASPTLSHFANHIPCQTFPKLSVRPTPNYHHTFTKIISHRPRITGSMPKIYRSHLPS